MPDKIEVREKSCHAMILNDKLKELLQSYYPDFYSIVRQFKMWKAKQDRDGR